MKIAEPRALIVSGEARCLLSLSSLLQQLGITFKRNTTGANVIHQLCDALHLPHIIFLDLALPQGDAFDICRTLKKDAMLKKIPVVALISNTERVSKDELHFAGFAGYFLKPLARPTITATLPALLNGDSMWDNYAKGLE